MTELRKRMLEELQRRNYAQSTIQSYLGAIEDFARYFRKRPDRLSQQDLRKYHLHLIQERKLAVPTVVARIAALRFFFVKTLHRPYLRIDLPYPRRPVRLPTVLSLEEVGRLINSARNRYHFVILMTLYSAGLRRSELCRLKFSTGRRTPAAKFRFGHLLFHISPPVKPCGMNDQEDPAARTPSAG